MRRFGLICNTRAGGGHKAELIRSTITRLRAEGHEVREYQCSASPAESAARAVRENCDVIVACGGDGTVSGVASAILASGKLLGVLPLGTLNHFARDLGIRDMADAERALLEGAVREIDAGVVNDRIFVNNSGIGIYPEIVLQREAAQEAGMPKWPALVVACIKALVKLPFLRLRIEADGRSIARITPFLFVGNNVYETKGFSIGERKILDAGVLGVCTARHPGPTGLVRIAFRALIGTLRQDRDFTLLIAQRLTVRTRRFSERHVSLDGELFRMKPPFEFSILPKALKVLAP